MWRFIVTVVCIVVQRNGVAGQYRYLSTPKDLQAVVTVKDQALGICDVNLTWAEVHYKKSWKPLIYIVKWENTTDYTTVTSETGVNAIKATGLLKDKTYVFSVKVKQGWLISDWSRSLHVTTSSPSVVEGKDSNDDDPRYPKPRSLKVKYLSPISFKLKWRDAKDAKTLKVKGYRVTWKQKKGETHKSDLITKRSYSVKGLKPDSIYLLRIQTVYKSKLSKSLTLFCKTQREFDVSPPASVRAKAVGTTKIQVSWSPNRKQTDSKIVGYKIQYKRRGIRRGDVCTAMASSWKSRYVITDLLKGEAYKIRIAAKSRYATGPYSSWRLVKLPGGVRNRSNDEALDITTTPPPTPSPEELFGLNIEQISAGVNITWNDVSSDVVTYMVEITQDSQILYIKEVYRDPLALEVYSLDPGGEYNVTVRAVSSREIGHFSASFSTPVPVTVVTDGPHVTLTGGNLTLRCITQGIPRPQYEWVLGQGFTRYDITKFEEENFNKYLMLLELYDIPEDFQNPICKSQNNLEYVAKEHRIHIIGAVPPPVNNVSVTALNQRKIEVEWDIPIEHEYLNVTYLITIEDNFGNYWSEEETSLSRYVFRNLTANTEYRVSVIAKTSNGRSSSGNDIISVRTEKALPKPTLQTLSWNDTAIVLNWATNSDTPPNMVRILYKKVSDQEFLVRKSYPQKSTMILQDLQRNSTYEMKVVVVYDKGEVVSNVLTIETNIASFLQENRRPTPPADAYLMVNKTAMTIRWIPPHPEYRTYVRQYRLDIYQDGILQRHLMDNKGRNFTLTPFDDTKEVAAYLTAVNNAGASDPILRTYKPLADEEKPTGAVGSLRGKALSSNSILVEWEPPTNKRLTRFLLRYRPLVEYNDSNIVDEWLGPSYNNYVLMGLRGAESYFISVIPYFNELVGNDSSIIARTYTGAPSAPPQDVTATNVNYTGITLQWRPPPDGQTNGVVTQYVVAFRSADKVEDTIQHTNNTGIIVRDLLPGTSYYMRVAAMTLNGTGPFTTWLTHSTLPLPVIRELPKQPENVTTKQVPYGIALRWDRPRDPDVPVHGYIVGYGRFIPEVYREVLSAGKTQYTIHKLRQNHDYIISVRAFNNFGESEAVIAVATAGDGRMTIVSSNDDDKEGDLNRFDDAPRNVSLELNHGEIPTVNVRWRPPPQIQGPSLGYNVYYKKEAEKKWRVKFADRTFLILRNLSFDTTYYVRVGVFYKDNTDARLSHTVEIKTFSLEDTIHALPTPSITSVFSGPDFLDVNWKPPLKDYLHVIVGFILGFGIKESNENQEFIPASQRSFRVTKLEPGTQYIISLAMFNEHGKSAKSIVYASTLDPQEQKTT
ncbi:fibronectin-like [Ostrea edulis]|uniref:fibronectin-like n=1 Tax=Ostrea edulis TaxID=37623 RepID=UPI0024AF4282|nr:fibronectin-like [Ostrea edulis]